MVASFQACFSGITILVFNRQKGEWVASIYVSSNHHQLSTLFNFCTDKVRVPIIVTGPEHTLEQNSPAGSRGRPSANLDFSPNTL